MIVSRCHRAAVYVIHGQEGGDHYGCTRCDTACDVYCPLEFSYAEVENAESVG